MTVRARVRGVYTTAVTQRLLAADHDVVDPSPPIRERFDDLTAGGGPATVRVETTDDRIGVELTGDEDAVDAVREALRVAPDALARPAALPADSVHDARVTETLGSGAVVDCGPDEAFLPYDAVDDYVETGDELRVQVRESAPPWADDRPLVGTALRVSRPLVELAGDRSGTTAALGGEDATELVRTTELLSAAAPNGWGLRWQPAALDADIDTMDAALDAAAETAGDLADLPPDVAPPRTVATPRATTWLRFGRESRFALDEDRRAVTTTMPGHHRIKAGTEAASAAVDFAEAVADPDADDAFPFEAVARQFGPREGDRVAIAHGKPDGREFVLGRGEVTSVDGEKVTVRREMRSAGTYDGLGTDREPGDEAVTKLREGRSWYPTVYRGADGESKGTYVNVCTPVEIFPDAVRYVDLHVDVVKRPDGTVERVDDDELDAAVDAGDVPEQLAEQARTVAASVERALSE